jgi:hypothetical protein
MRDIRTAYDQACRSLALGLRKQLPGQLELFSLVHNLPMKVKVSTSSRTSKTFLFNSNTLGSEIYSKVLEWHSLKPTVVPQYHFLLTAFQNGPTDDPLPILPILPGDRLADILSYIERLTVLCDDNSYRLESVADFPQVPPLNVIFMQISWDLHNFPLGKLPLLQEGCCLENLCVDWAFSHYSTLLIKGDLLSWMELNLEKFPILLRAFALLFIAKQEECAISILPDILFHFSNQSPAIWGTQVSILATEIKRNLVSKCKSHEMRLISFEAKREFLEHISKTFQFSGCFVFYVNSTLDARFQKGAIAYINDSGMFVLDKLSRVCKYAPYFRMGLGWRLCSHYFRSSACKVWHAGQHLLTLKVLEISQCLLQ